MGTVRATTMRRPPRAWYALLAVMLLAVGLRSLLTTTTRTRTRTRTTAPIAPQARGSAAAARGEPVHRQRAPRVNTNHSSVVAPTLTIALISNNREDSLRRLCESLLTAEYDVSPSYFSRVDLVFNLEASSSASLETYAREFQWPHGAKSVRRRTRQGGLIVAVSESWYPSSPLDYGCLLEDDIEVSPHYFKWVTKVLLGLGNSPDPRVVGISLYSPRITETTNPKSRFDSTSLVSSLMGEGHAEAPYMMQTPCSWGAVYFPVR